MDDNKLWKFLKRWEYQTTLPASWETYMQDKKQLLDMKKQTGSKLGKEVRQGCILSPYLFNFYAEYVMWNAGLDDSQARIKIAGRNINDLRYAGDTTLMAESKEETKEPHDEGERGEWKSWLKTQRSKNENHDIQSHHLLHGK